jgi:5-methylcytosine-specific restriction protein A
MSRSVEEWVGKDDNARPPLRVRMRVFLAYEGRCHWSGRKIMPGDLWDVDHVVALCNEGQNRETNLAPILRGKPHNEKTAADVAEKAKVARMRAKHMGQWPRGPKIASRGFEKRRVQP